jgi:hypothetical protein
MSEDQVKLNERVISKDDFDKKKEKVEKNKGMKIVEVNKNEYKIRIQE